MEPTTTWQIIVLIVILMTHFSQANKACPTESTRNSNFPVIHLCTNEAASDVQGVFLDAFVSANNPVSCSCTLETRQSLQIGINPVILPDRNCTSTLHISSSQGPVIYNCKKINITIPMYRRNLQNEGVFIKLTTRAGNENTTYCISLIITDGQGSLTLQCHSPDGRSMSSSTQPYDKTTSLRSTTLSSSRTESTKSEKADTSSPLTGPVKSEISDTTVPVEKTNIHTEPKAFPVAATVGGAVGAFLIVAVVVIVIIIYIRKKRTKGKHNTSDDDDVDYVIRDVNPNNVDTNLNPSVANNNVTRFNTDDNTGNTYEHLQHNTGNTYEHLQHNTIQYVNTPSSVDGDHVYLHVNEPTQSQISDQDYYNTANMTGSNSLDSHE
ncbi:uncharacterized protein LOC121390012 isoform X1 [Gigantopelta aegis]|uniref:uncharacterized protein LOC121390012 isoform X1 n=1 Tax=Gigantopelta aegis TaxID=1735272 RepID=UPI001B88743B|nr:uncharacterized protein LOC121390012 isoform X1 [Gigantopelta aegis]